MGLGRAGVTQGWGSRGGWQGRGWVGLGPVSEQHRGKENIPALNLQDEMNRSFIAIEQLQIGKETFSRLQKLQRILSSTFQLIFQRNTNFVRAYTASAISPVYLHFKCKSYQPLTESLRRLPVTREVHATDARNLLSGLVPEPMQKTRLDQNSGKLHVSLARTQHCTHGLMNN
ncbi:hypothetical protein Tco_0052770 [Tanacetum coccineum]